MTTGQQDDNRFVRYSIDDGLPHAIITCIYQDSTGFIWFGTGDGLVRYDGYDYKIFKAELNSPNTISNNIIRDIKGDRNGNLWVATDKGLNYLDLSTGKIKQFYSSAKQKNSLLHNSISTISLDKQGKVWVGFGYNRPGFQIMDPEEGKFFLPDQVLGIKDTAIQNSNILFLFADSDKDIWVSHVPGLSKYSYGDTAVKKIPYTILEESPIPGILSWTPIIEIIEDRFDSRYLYLATHRGISKLDKSTGLANNYAFQAFDEENYTGSIVVSLMHHSPDRLWVGTRLHGVYVFDPTTDTFGPQYQFNPLNQSSISSNYVSFIFQDSYQNVWFGTMGEGINKIIANRKKIEHYYYSPSNGNSLSEKKVWSVFEDSDKKVWIGTESKGIDILDRTTNKITHIGSEESLKSTIGPGIVSSICEDDKGYIWAITWFGTLNRIDKKTLEVKKYRGGGHDLLGWTFLDMIYDKGYLWIAEKHIERFDILNEKSEIIVDNNGFLGNSEIRCIHLWKDKILWCGTFSGLVALNLSTRESKRLLYDAANEESIQCPGIMSIYQQNDSVVWCGTEGCGLYKIDTRDFSHVNFDIRNGLPSNNIFAIYDDMAGNLWLSTSNGICKFNYLNFSVRNYDEADGIQDKEFKWGAHFMNEKGEIFFGGANGLNIFHPDSIRDNMIHSRPVLTELRIKNRVVYPGDSINKKIILKKDISQTKKLELGYKEADLFFEFAGLHYTAPEKIEYSFILEGHDEDWVNTNFERRFAVYNNLEPGEYVFRVRSSNNDGLWCSENEQVELTISISPPFWKTWLFKILVILFIALLINSVFLVRTKYLRLQKTVLERKVVERTNIIENQNEELLVQAENLKLTNDRLQELGHFKESMMSMIVHDLKNPINTVIGLVNDIQIKIKGKILEREIAHLRQSGKKMLHLVQNILDVQKFEESKVSLKQEECAIGDIIYEALEQLDLLVKEKNLKIHNQIDGRIILYVDKDYLIRVFVNLLNNAIKFSDNSGEIILSIEDKGKSIDRNCTYNFKIQDKGIGIDPDKISLIFDKYRQVEVRKSGITRSTGLGLTFCKMVIEAHGGKIWVESKKGIGTVFYIQLTGYIRKENEEMQYGNKKLLDKGIKLTKEEIQILKPIYEKITFLDVYEASKVTDLLELIEDNLNEGIKQWKEEVLNALYRSDEVRFNHLIKKISKFV